MPLAGGERLDLYHIGRSALVWRYGFTSATEDVDVVVPGGESRLLTEAERLFGKGTPKATEHGLYLEKVPSGLPPVAGGAYRRATEARERWAVLRLFHLEPHDLAVTKMKRFAGKDRQDIRAMCDAELLDPVILEQRLNAAWYYSHEMDGDPGREAAFRNLGRVVDYLEGRIDSL